MFYIVSGRNLLAAVSVRRSLLFKIRHKNKSILGAGQVDISEEWEWL